MNPESNRRGSNEELVYGEMGQVGTQFDGFAHQTIGERLYNCFDARRDLLAHGLLEARHRERRHA